MSDKKPGNPGTVPQPASVREGEPHRGAALPEASDWLSRLLLQLAGMAIADAARMARYPSSSLHALRVRMKKLRALLRLGESAIPPRTNEALTNVIRAVKNPLGPARDAEVLEKTARSFDVPLSVSHSPAAAPLPDVQPQLYQLRLRLSQLDLSGLQWSDITASAERTERRVRKAMKRSRSSGWPSEFHRWRRRVKDRYFQQLALRGKPKSARRIRKLGRLLGKVQDLAMLEQHLRPAADNQGLRYRVICERLAHQRMALRKGRKACR